MINQQRENSTEKPSNVLYISAILVALFVLWGTFSPQSLSEAAGNALGWMITNFGWFYMLVAAFFVLFVIILAISPYGKIRLGKDDDRPEFSWISWVGMLFAAGIGVGFVFWGVAEPVLNYLNPPVGYEPNTSEAAIAGLRYGVYHWALHPWAIFSVVGLTLAYVQFRMNRPALISSAFYPILGKHTEGWLGQIIDILAVLATCTGVATTFGLSAMQMSGGIAHLTPIPNTIWTQIVIIGIVTVLFIFSAARGVDRGIKILSNINIVVAGLLLVFVLTIGPTIFIFESMVTTLGGYISNIIPMSLTMTPFNESEWLGNNTIFFWAWHISWAPFMGLFIARISKGRTIREFIAGILLAPTVLALIWFTTFGGTALNLEIYGPGGIADLVTDNVEIALFATLAELPLSAITSSISMLLIFIFFITSADSATYVLGAMTSRGSLNPSLSVKLIWGFLIAGTASVLLLSGGGGLDALQTASIIAALPFGIIMILMVISILIMLKRDWASTHPNTRFRRKGKKERSVQAITEQVKKEVREEVKEEIYEEVKEKIYKDIKNDL
ncbi:BCCT family transporter [Virgibacillus sp. W0430]|uniref:BCCT family transporter n=1 Tax=Virgibacillus sp. W0430 TaxID=3391580 RepID=UPI003F4624DF